MFKQKQTDHSPGGGGACAIPRSGAQFMFHTAAPRALSSLSLCGLALPLLSQKQGLPSLRGTLWRERLSFSLFNKCVLFFPLSPAETDQGTPTDASGLTIWRTRRPVARRRRADDGEAEQTRRARRGREQDFAEISRRMYDEIRSSRDPEGPCGRVEDG